MSDIVERARRDANYTATHGNLIRELADEIERLKAALGTKPSEAFLIAERERLQIEVAILRAAIGQGDL